MRISKCLPGIFYLLMAFSSFFFIRECFADLPSNKDPNVEREYYPDHKLFSEIHFEVTPQGRVGHHKAYFEDGTLQEDFTSLNGQRSGLGKWYYADGTLQTEQTYANNALDGVSRWYNDDGVVYSEVEYKQGRVNGLKKEFYMDGMVQSETAYLDQNPSGVARHYTLKGKLEWEGTYVDGKLSGEFKWFNSDGSILLSCQITPNGVGNLVLHFNNDPSDGMGWTGILLAAQDFNDLDTMAEHLLKNKITSPINGYWQLGYFFDGLKSSFNLVFPNHQTQQIDFIRKWITAKPNSVTPYIAMADALFEQAWEVRGNDYIQSVTQERYDKFLALLDQSQKTLNYAEKLDPSYPVIYPIEIMVALGSNSGPDAIETIFTKAVELNPYYPPLYSSMMTSLLPRWGGAPGAEENFADRAAKLTKDKEGEGYYSRIAIMASNYVQKEFINEYNFSWPRMKQGFEDLLKNYPDNHYFLSYYAWLAGEYKDQAAAQRAFSKLGPFSNRMMAFKSKKDFDKWNQWAGKSADKEYPGDKPIHIAAQKGDVEELAKLIKNGANINEQDKDGKTPLYLALDNLNSDAAAFLLNAGADPNIASIHGWRPISLAAQSHMPLLVELLLQKGANVEGRDVFHPEVGTPLLLAASSGDVESCELLLNQGAQLNVSTGDYQTPLHWAAKNGHRPVVELLLKQPHVQANAQDFWKQTPLHKAVIAQNAGIVELLLAAGAKKDILDYQGKTALDLARQLRNEEITAILEK